MRFQKLLRPSILFLLLVLLLVGQLPSLGHGRRITERKWQGKSSPSVRYFPKISPSQVHDEDDLDPTYGVSKRLVPQGPNPLHN